jgi:uncharacterized phage protein gp47/JayE
MAFQRPTLTELVTRIEADYVSRLTGGGTLLRRAVVKVLARVHAGAMHLLYGFVAFIARQIMPDTAEGEYLLRWAAVWGITKKAATYTTFNAVFTGADGTAIPIGTELSRADGELYVTTGAGTIASGTATVACEARNAGSGPGLDGGEVLSLSSPIAGVDSSATVSGAGILDGSDQEEDEDLLARLLTRIQTPPHGGNQLDYETWALEVAGVTRAWCYPNHLGTGTVGVTFVRDGDSPIIPDGTEVAAVQDYIDDRRPVTADVTVFAPTAVPLNFTISGVSDPTVRAAIQAELADLIRREAKPAGTIYLSRINEAISKAEGEFDHGLTAPVANVTTTTGQLTTMGSVTWI